MSKSNAAPVRDWLMKKYEKALRTIFEQNDELGALKEANEQLRQHIHTQARHSEQDMFWLSSEKQDLLARIMQLSVEGRVQCFVTNLIEGTRIPLKVGAISSANGETQIDCEFPGQIEIPDEAHEFPAFHCQDDSPPTMLGAVNDALDGYAAKQSQQTALDSQGYPQGAISSAFHD